MLNNDSWLITGGCGFIGTALIKNLIRNSHHRIRVLDNLSVGSREDLARLSDFKEISIKNQFSDYTGLSPANMPLSSETVQLVVGDIRDPETCLMCARDIDVIVHLAANTGVAPSVENPRADMEVNVFGTLNLLEAARQNDVKRFIFASSGAPVGEAEPPIHEEMAPHPVSPYGASKLAGEGYCSAYYHTFGINTVALRFGNVCGPGSSHKSSLVAKFIRQSLQGQTCEIYGDGKQTRDFIFIDDLVDAVLKAAQFEHGGEIFQIATSKEHTVNEVAEILKEELGKKGADIHLEHSSSRRGDVRRNFSDTAKAKKLLGWEAEVDLREGIMRTVDWFLGI
jgi:UDP-glucose 4-epimerase